MLRITLVAALLCAAGMPAFAADMKCDNDSMMKMQADIDAMDGKTMKMQKDTATSEMAMAMDSMKASKMDDCMMHMENAQKNMGKM